MNVKEIWGAFIGLIIGYALTKIYLIWIMLIELTHQRVTAAISFQNGLTLFQIITRNQTIFTYIIVSGFTYLGYKFVKTFLYHKNN